MPLPESPALSCTATLATASVSRPPIILIHGSANSAAVWTLWQQAFATHGWSTFALDLRGHGNSPPIDLAAVRMSDYASDVRTLIQQLNQPLLLRWLAPRIVAGALR